MSPRLSRLILGHVQHNTAPFAHRPQVCGGRGPFFVSFSVCFLFLFLSFVADRFPSGSLSQALSLVDLSAGWSPFFESTQLHHAAVAADDVWFGFGSFFLVRFSLIPVVFLLPSFSSLVPLAYNKEANAI